MPGPPPKPPEQRQRRNRPPTAADLSRPTAEVRQPSLPRRIVGSGEHAVEVKWHERTRAWWRELWRSPLAPRFLRADIPGLQLLAQLHDDFHQAQTPRERLAIAAEIRLQEQRWGLDQLARLRLQWTVAGDLPTKTPRAAAGAPPPTPAPDQPAGPRPDPRKVLAMPAPAVKR